MRKLRYRCEDSVAIYRYFAFFLIVLTAVAVIAGIISYNVVMPTMTEIMWMLICAFLVLIPISIYVYFIIRVDNHKDVKKIKKVFKNGTRVDGTIVGWDDSKSFDILGRNYFLFVEYEGLNGEKNSVRTPELNFNPRKVLGSNMCSVYIDGEDFYVTDFLSAKETTVRIFRKTSPYGEEQYSHLKNIGAI